MTGLLELPERCACGRPACFGFGVNLRKGRVGRWACGETACRVRAEHGEKPSAEVEGVRPARAAARAAQPGLELPQLVVRGEAPPVRRTGVAAGEDGAARDDTGPPRRHVVDPHVPLADHGSSGARRLDHAASRGTDVADLFSTPAAADGRAGGAGQGWGERG